MAKKNTRPPMATYRSLWRANMEVARLRAQLIKADNIIGETERSYHALLEKDTRQCSNIERLNRIIADDDKRLRELTAENARLQAENAQQQQYLDNSAAQLSRSTREAVELNELIALMGKHMGRST